MKLLLSVFINISSYLLLTDVPLCVDEKHPELITSENSAEKLFEKIKTEKALAAGRKKPQSKKTKKK